MAFDASKLKHLPKILPDQELRIFNSLLAVFILSTFSLLLGIFLKATIAAPQAGSSYTEGVVGRPRLINPLYSDNNSVDRDLVKLTYAGLVKFDGEKIIPDLADIWEISPDQKTYTFFLKQGITWADGETFDAQDVVFTIQTIQNPKYQSPLLASFNGIEVEAIDQTAVKFTLPKPLTPFLESLSVGILPEHIWSNIPVEAISLTDFNIQPLGLGPYKFKKLVKNKFGTIHSYFLERNNDYHLGQPFIKDLAFRFYDTVKESLEGLQRNEVEGISFLPLSSLQDFKQKSINLHAFQLPQYTAVFFNTSASSQVVDIAIRQALSLSVNKQEILQEAISGEGSLIDGPILPGFPGYNANIEKFPFDPAQAAQILDEAGWLPAGDNLRKNDDEVLSVTLTTANTSELVKAAEIIQKSWQNIGIQVELKIVDTSAIQGSIISPRKFDVLLFGEIVGLDPDPYPFWHSSQISTQGLNLSNFKHAEADQVLQEARETPDLNKKAEKYVHFQNILVAEIPAIFLYNPNYLYPVGDKIKGLDQSLIINAADRFARVHEWYIKTKRVLK
jgi:peptide/nickel transport system substrate-binding protein